MRIQTTGKKPALMGRLLNDPIEMADHLDLRYIRRDKLSILRVKNGEHFVYLKSDKPIAEKTDLKRINSLVIPPAWEDVKIAPFSNAHLQAVGYDVKKRLQYRYHPIWRKIRNRTKFYRMLPFGQVLPKIRKQVEEDLKMKGWPKNKVLALIIKLMEETHIRVGNEQYAKRNKTYGLSTLRTKHLKLFKDKLRFEFTGKRGKEHKITLRNKKLIQLVSKCEEIPGWELFQFYNDDGKKMSVDSSMVNDYLFGITKRHFTAKDFRTWAGTVIFFESLTELPTATSPKEIQQNILKAYDSTAKALGNTRNVCRKYYVHPLIVEKYEDDSLFLEMDKKRDLPQDAYQSPSEIAVLELIQNYSPLQQLKIS